MYVSNVFISTVLKSGPLIESHLRFIVFVFLRFSSLFLWDGDFFFFNYFLTQLWEESWDLQKTGRSLSKIFLEKNKCCSCELKLEKTRSQICNFFACY